MTTMREVTWGEALVVAAFRAPRGLQAATERIQSVIGEHIGTRNTFGKLMKESGPDALSPRDQFRAWLLLTALGEDAPEWGISDAVVPAGYDRDYLRAALSSTTPDAPGGGRADGTDRYEATAVRHVAAVAA